MHDPSQRVNRTHNPADPADLDQVIAHRRSRKRLALTFLGDYGLLVIFAAYFVFMSVTSDVFLTPRNLMNIVLQASIIGLIAIGQTFVMITAGIDLSVGAVAGFAGAIAATVAKSALHGWALPLLVGLGVGILVGLVNSFLVIKGHILPFLATLAMLATVRGVTLIYTQGYPVIGLNDSFLLIGQGSFNGVAIPILIFLAVAIVAGFLLSRTKFGRHVYAVGGNEEAARIVGIQVQVVKLKVYLISGLLTALAGVVLTSRVNAADPLAGTGYELDAIAATVIGGTSLFGGVGTVWGTVLGVLLLGMVVNGLDLLNVSSYYHQIIKGLILVAAVIMDRWKSQ
ncbi:MAG: ABC transporter permease [Chloroflexi bacterium]|nr:ABC transporter permease [Chloroflexota bacterium]MCL5074774.1 ABC transporter permease [Chloroflexota bacterium]